MNLKIGKTMKKKIQKLSRDRMRLIEDSAITPNTMVWVYQILHILNQ